MIISHEHRFIYVRCRKTGSTSLELALSRICGPDDVITPVCERDEKIRREIGGRGPQNHLSPDGQPRFSNHTPAREIHAVLGEAVWDRYFTWCVVRNPYDLAISAYYHRYKSPPRPPLRTFLLDPQGAAHYSNWSLYTIDDQPAVDAMVRYERLTHDLEHIIIYVLGLDLKVSDLPQAKSQFRFDQRPFWQVLTCDEEQLVADVFAQEIAMHHYQCAPLRELTA